MSHKAFSLVAGVIFSLIVLGHVIRLVFSVPWVVADWTVPIWVSMVAVLVAGFMAYEAFRLSAKQ
ncbi:MAG: hypothetical protein ACRD5I_13105 [Candidatus Acidiferrales bacterium]